MHIFSGNSLSAFLDKFLIALEQEINTEPKNQLLNVDEISYIDYLTRKYVIELIVFHWEHESITNYEQAIRASDFPTNKRFFMGFDDPNRRYTKNTVVYHVTFTGNSELLQYRPSTFHAWSPIVKVNNNELTFEVIDWNNNIEEIKGEIEKNKNSICQLTNYLNMNLNTYNTSIKNRASQIVKNRKNELLRQSQLLESIGLPIKRMENISSDLIIPIQKKAIIIQKPVSSNSNFQAEPALENALYQDILKICHTLGVQMERLPSTYRGENNKVKCEESLRDLFLLHLGLHFENSATGETFNKSGKTDILIRHEGKNAFIAECKFWRGAKHHQKTIDQLLNYLSWRDSKSAIIYFVDKKSLQQVLDQINSETPQHKCFIKHVGNKDEGWLNYHFHLFDDQTRSVKLTILVFHFI